MCIKDTYTESSDNKRIMYIDIAKGIAIISVIIAHIFPKESFVSELVYTYLIPCFFVFSGLLIKSKIAKEKASRMLSKNNNNLIIYLCLSLIYLIYDVIIHGIILHKESILGLIKWDVLQTLSMYGINVLWFLSAIYITKIVYELIVNAIRNETIKHVFIIAISLIAIIVGNIIETLLGGNNHQGLLAIVYFVALGIFRPLGLLMFLDIGNLVMRVITTLQRKYDNIYIYVIGFILFVLNISLIPFAGNIDWHFMKFDNTIMMLITSIVGSIGILFISIFIEDKASVFGGFLAYFGKNSLLIMVIHNYIIIDLISYFLPKIWDTNYISRFIIVTIVTIILVMIVEKSFNKFLQKIKNR